MERRFGRGLSLLAGVVLAAWAGGCGVDERPTAPAAIDEPGAVAQAPTAEAPAYIVLGPPSRAKIAETSGVRKTVSQSFYPDRWGGMEFSDWSWTSADVDGSIIVKRVWFAVEYGAIQAPSQITMTTAWGSRVGDVSVAFTPAGQTFNPPATLQIWLHGPLTDAMFAGGAYHIDANGKATRVNMQITKERTDGNNSQWVITIKLGGFSRYSLGGGA